ncbi:Smr protein/MutS2 C-terminal [Conidiobolus coronatus NRRL 28638]|uniref:Smr protein/MutS2 C-terminal n=1 Tax=Conidiobolus coronatus (strain ATCC 28846 / CBS 209.66 / NRRL 28638) TaxID=796925 RepID=A0A137PD48_CONC2|nr:Smr protein/MutS2 C-terminal [Conidiobolus coronatus NRRL 28638]|eukprot:KXN72913.1 Smr protein/MutS2 C-terminal [Conidiobolus coronatus NRRL 28638]
MDLHGLYVEEAMDRVKERLRTVNRGDCLCIIVGKGNHSTNHLAKIKPAVERFLTEQNLRHEFQAGNEGAIVVYF